MIARSIAQALFEKLQECEVEVFYDRNEQHRILAENLESYLLPIYQSEAIFVIPLLTKSYPERIWAKFESDAFKDRFGQNSIIPVWFTDAPPGMFDQSRNYGGVSFNPDSPFEPQILNIAELAVRKLEEARNT